LKFFPNRICVMAIVSAAEDAKKWCVELSC
jgi:hypothetical protein